LRIANVGARPSSGFNALARRGRSRSTSWRCRAMVAVEITTVEFFSTAWWIAGTR
jgi:hypothetical protein